MAPFLLLFQSLSVKSEPLVEGSSSDVSGFAALLQRKFNKQKDYGDAVAMALCDRNVARL